MNLTNWKTPIPRVFEFVRREAARYGVTVLERRWASATGRATATVSTTSSSKDLSVPQLLETKLREHRIRGQGPFPYFLFPIPYSGSCSLFLAR